MHMPLNRKWKDISVVHSEVDRVHRPGEHWTVGVTALSGSNYYHINVIGVY